MFDRIVKVMFRGKILVNERDRRPAPHRLGLLLPPLDGMCADRHLNRMFHCCLLVRLQDYFRHRARGNRTWAICARIPHSTITLAA